jgi:hypothetical protein
MKLQLSADLLVAIGHVLERVCSGAAKVKFNFQEYEIEASLIDKGQKINIEIRPRREESNAEEEGGA